MARLASNAECQPRKIAASTHEFELRIDIRDPFDFVSVVVDNVIEKGFDDVDLGTVVVMLAERLSFSDIFRRGMERHGAGNVYNDAFHFTRGALQRWNRRCYRQLGTTLRAWYEREGLCSGLAAACLF